MQIQVQFLQLCSKTCHQNKLWAEVSMQTQSLKFDLVLKDVQDVFLDFVHQVQLEEGRNKID